MSEFKKRYENLNTKQREAVDAIDGPVMVVAGPGTGKTELLSVRVANILKKTDTLPSNILCLTFTDSGAAAMRQRLASLLGSDAYKIAVHTFHSFGSETINQYGEYFYNGANFRPANELSTHEIMVDIMQTLPHSDPLSGTMNDEFTHQKDILTSISELKRGGLTPDELDKIVGIGQKFTGWVQPHIHEAFGDRLSKKTFPLISKLLESLSSYTDEPLNIIGYTPLSQLIKSSLESALEDAEAEDSTKPISAWKKLYLEKNSHGEQDLRDAKRSLKLKSLVGIYQKYLEAMQERELYDYDDMILRTVHAMEVFPELRFNLQESYQYILVDEFQDTNDAQMRLIWNLTNNPSQEGRPNIMVVGDDDQAIYRFQGAELSNILDFKNRYREVRVVTLTDNYRSQTDILSLARQVIVQGGERLENSMPDINKTLTPHHKPSHPLVKATSHETTSQSHFAISRQIAEDIAKNPDETRAVIARNHRQLIALIPHLSAANIPIHYEHIESALDTEPMQQLELVTRAVHSLSHDLFEEADEFISQILAHPAWNVPARDIWQLSIDSKNSHATWLETMLTKRSETSLESIAEWLVVAAQLSKSQPIEYLIDYLFGTDVDRITESNQAEPSEESEKTTELPKSISPLYSYFFSTSRLKIDPASYLNHLSALRTIRSRMRELHSESKLTLCDLIGFIDSHRELGINIQTKNEIETGENPVELLSAHKAKGLEYDSVYIIDAQENIWGSGAKKRNRLLRFTSNLALSPAGDSDDERLRLLYVALTRAKNQLFIASARRSESGKALQLIGSMSGLLDYTELPSLNIEDATTASSTDWYAPLINLPANDQHQLLAPMLKTYKLSPTHLVNFLNVTSGGPEAFLINNLLAFPQAMQPSAAYGSAIHTTLQQTHQHLNATKKIKPTEDVLQNFEKNLSEFEMSETDHDKFLERGYSTLTAFLDQRYSSFRANQITERTFKHSHVKIGDALITGIIDLIDIDEDEKTIFITDYKTGKAVPSWRGKTEYEKIKMHHYEQQLMFYKLLVENSGKFAGYTVTGGRIEFVEPDPSGKIILLDYTYGQDKILRFEKLISSVWQHIMSLDFTMPDNQELKLDSILQFEKEILGEINPSS